MISWRRMNANILKCVCLCVDAVGVGDYMSVFQICVQIACILHDNGTQIDKMLVHWMQNHIWSKFHFFHSPYLASTLHWNSLYYFCLNPHSTSFLELSFFKLLLFYRMESFLHSFVRRLYYSFVVLYVNVNNNFANTLNNVTFSISIYTYIVQDCKIHYNTKILILLWHVTHSMNSM